MFPDPYRHQTTSGYKLHTDKLSLCLNAIDTDIVELFVNASFYTDLETGKFTGQVSVTLSKQERVGDDVSKNQVFKPLIKALDFSLTEARKPLQALRRVTRSDSEF